MCDLFYYYYYFFFFYRDKSLPLDNDYVKEMYSLDQSNKYLRQSSAILYSIILFLLTILLPLLLHLIFKDDPNRGGYSPHHYYSNMHPSSFFGPTTFLGTVHFDADNVAVDSNHMDSTYQNKILLLFYLVDADRLIEEKMEFLAHLEGQLADEFRTVQRYTTPHLHLAIYYQIVTQPLSYFHLAHFQGRDVPAICSDQGFSSVVFIQQNMDTTGDSPHVLSSHQIESILEKCHYTVVEESENNTTKLLPKLVQGIQQLISKQFT
ncbi:hypothetical protein RFI_30107 [Reticulomyxa filosa]|uniref:Uncharacterized protein n=1 Tax=Reticulomyxa filosa TaxID=46433 RepID=X6M072_RETFI|nr:hypothetical protein RFI_30107 [Reticulomyxa filosa]|eukprot:ETO07284.1 hypothetical protein RFI_30107 [Reticulomyxa filosa]